MIGLQPLSKARKGGGVAPGYIFIEILVDTIAVSATFTPDIERPDSYFQGLSNESGLAIALLVVSVSF